MKSSHFTAPLFIAILIVCNSFKPVQKNSTANGGGIADGISFSFNVVGQKKGVAVGNIQYGDNSYVVNWASWNGNSIILGTTDGYAFYISDNGKPSGVDWISDPILAPDTRFISSSDFYGLHFVSSGNIQVKE